MLDLTFEVLGPKISVTTTRIAIAIVRYGILEFHVEICVYRDSHLWVRMPEQWMNNKSKTRFVWIWDEVKCGQFQVLVLKKVFDLIGLDLQVAIQKRREHKLARKVLTEQKNKLTLR